MKETLAPLFLSTLFAASALAQSGTESPPSLASTNGVRERTAALQARAAEIAATMAERKAARLGSATHLDAIGAVKTNLAAAQVQVVADGAVARFGPHRVTFAANAKTAGAVDLRTPTGERLRSHVLGLAYLTDDGRSVMLAELVDRTGEVLPPNRVIYRDAFAGAAADLIYEYTASSLDQTLVVRKKLPPPSVFNLEEARVRLAVLTEFIEAPEPQQTTKTISLREPYAALGIESEESLADVTLRFGSMRIGKGKAFTLGATANAVPVGKAWQLLRGPQGELRRFLIESTPYLLIKPQLDALTAAVTPKAGEGQLASSGPRPFKEMLLGCEPPKPKLALDTASGPGNGNAGAQPAREGMTLAQAALESTPGVVLDYVIVNTLLTGGVWFEDELPPDAYEMGDNEWWTWTDYWYDGDGWGGNEVCPYSGSTMHVSDYVPGDFHQHYFAEATSVLQPGTGDVLYAWVNLDSSYQPDEVMLQWREWDEVNGESWEHRAYWGENYIAWGTNNTQSRSYRGNLPASGVWVRLEVPASELGVVGKIVDGMAFTLYGGRAAWDQAGMFTVLGPDCANAWVEDQLPPGAYEMWGGEGWSWTNSWQHTNGWGGNAVTPYAGTNLHVSANVASNYHQHYFQEAVAKLQPGTGDVLYAYVNLDSSHPPSEVMLQWRVVDEYGAESWEHRAYWGTNMINWGTDNTASRTNQGALPAAGQWVRLEVPASAVGLVGKNIDGVAFTLYGGRAAWDHAGACNPDTDGDGLPDAWELAHFGNLAQGPDDNYDDDGWTNLEEYIAGSDPNTVAFYTVFNNLRVSSATATGTVSIVQGVPAQRAVLVNSTNFAAASWSPYAATFPVSLGATNGRYEVWIGVKGQAETSVATWQGYWLTRDTNAPMLVITNPVSDVVFQSLLQLQGYSPEPLASLRYDLTNASGLLTNLEGYVVKQFMDTNTLEMTTNWFEYVDIELTNGLNTLTLYATDRAGNMTSNSYSYTFMLPTNAPVVKLWWPQDGARVSGTNFTVRGWSSDATAQVTAQVVGGGVTNSVEAIVERDGKFWIESLPLASGTNEVSVAVVDVATNTTTTNFAVIQSAVELRITPPSESVLNDPFIAVAGTINSTDCRIWINGVEVTNLSGGEWDVASVPLPEGGTAAIQARAIPNSDNGGNGTGGSGGELATLENLGNPQSATATDAEYEEDKPMAIVKSAYGLGRADVTTQLVAVSPLHDYQRCALLWQRAGPGERHAGWCYGTPTTEYFLWGDAEWGRRGIAHEDNGLRVGTAVCGEKGVTSGVDFVVEDGWPGEFCTVARNRLEFDGFSYWDRYRVRAAATYFELRTGGKAKARHKNLFVLTGEAIGIGDAFYPEVDTWPWPYDIAPTSVVLGGLGALGSDGRLYKVLPDGGTYDVTPTVAGNPYYGRPQPQATKHALMWMPDCIGDLPISRTSLGVGESVACYMAPAISVGWSVTGGGLLSATNGPSTLLTASKSPSVTTIHARIRGEELAVTFTVFPPASITVVSNWDVSLGVEDPGGSFMAARTDYRIVIGPTNVSFAAAELRENLPALSVTWPNGTNTPININGTTNSVSVICGNTINDQIGEVLRPTSLLFNGTSNVDFFYTYSWTYEYKNATGTWVPFADPQTKTEYRGADKNCREVYKGVPGGWQGPWQ